MTNPADTKKDCTCGENTPGSVHRQDGPCYQKEWPTGFEPCIHAVPQADSCLNGICVFCYRDRLAKALAKAALADRMAKFLGKMNRKYLLKSDSEMAKSLKAEFDALSTQPDKEGKPGEK